MKKRPSIWNRTRQVGERLIRALIPLTKVKYTLYVYYESGVYEKVQLEKMNAEIQRAIQCMPEVGNNVTIDTEIIDHATECRSGRASLYDVSKP